MSIWVHIVKYSDNMYHEDDAILGVFWTADDAEEFVKQESGFYNSPSHRAYDHNYRIVEMAIAGNPPEDL